MEWSSGAFESSPIFSSAISSVVPSIREEDCDVAAGLVQFRDLFAEDFPQVAQLDATEFDLDFHPYLIGQGASYQVYATKFKKWDYVVAVKYARVVFRPKSEYDSHFGDPRQERQKLAAILQEVYSICWFNGNPNISSLLGWSYEINDGALTARLITEYSRHGDLRKFLKAQSLPSMESLRKICVDVATGLSVLHENGVVQGDLKLDNILVFDNPNGGLIAKISDFGFAIILAPMQKMPRYQGTKMYNAPEVASQHLKAIPQAELPACDVYSFGLMVWEVFNQGDPYHSGRIPVTVGMIPEEGFLETLEVSLAYADCQTENQWCRLLTAVFEATLHTEPSHRCNAQEVRRLLDVGCQESREQNFQATLIPSKSKYHVQRQRQDTEILRCYHHKYSWASQANMLQRLKARANHPKDPRNAESALAVGSCYTIGIGVKPDFELRLEWLQKAALLGSQFSAAVLASLTGSQIENPEHPEDSALRDECRYLVYFRTLGYRNSLYGVEFQAISDETFVDWQPRLIKDFLLKNHVRETKGLEVFLSSKANLTFKVPILHYAAFQGDLGTLQLLLEVSTNVDVLNRTSGETALLCALAHQQYEAAKLLLAYGANPSISNHAKINASHFLGFVPKNDLPVLAEQIIRHGGQQNLLKSVQFDEPEDGRAFGKTPLGYAAAAGNLAAVRILLREAEVTYKNQSEILREAFEIASRQLYADICQAIGDFTMPLPTFPLHMLGMVDIHCIDLGHGPHRKSAAINTIKILQRIGYDINGLASGMGDSMDGMTPLSSVVKWVPAAPDIVSALIEEGANIRERDKNGATPLVNAVLAAENSRNAGYVPLLLGEGSDAESLAPYEGFDSGPLHIACDVNAHGAAETLIKCSSVNIDACNGDGKTPLHISCGRNLVSLVQMLLEANAHIDTIDNNGLSPLEEAVRKGCSATVIYLLDSGVSVYNLASPTKRTILMFAVSLYITKVQVEASLNVLRHERIKQAEVLDWSDENGITAIGKAVMSCQYTVVNELLELGAPVHHPPARQGVYVSGYSPLLMMIASSAKLDFAGHLKDYEYTLTALVKQVISDGGLETRDITGSTALHWGCRATNLPAVSILLSNGADTNARDSRGQTPLHRAIRGVLERFSRLEKGDELLIGPPANDEQLEDRLTRIIDFLIDHGADINAADLFGYTVLHDAILQEDFSAEMAQLLLAKGAAVSQVTILGETPLHMAVTRKRYTRDLVYSNKSGSPKSVEDIDSRKASILIKELIKRNASLDCVYGETGNILDKAILNDLRSEVECLIALGVTPATLIE